MRVVVQLDDRPAAVLAEEWTQSDAAEGVPGADLVVVQHPAARPGRDALVAAARAAGVPVVLWHRQVTPEPLPALADVALVATPATADEHPGVPVAAAAFAQRRHNPGRAGGPFQGLQPLVLDGAAGPDPVVVAAQAAAAGRVVLSEGTDDPRLEGPALDGLVLDTTHDPHLPAALARHAELRDRYAQPALRRAHTDLSGAAAARTLLRAAGLPSGDRSVSAVVPTMRPEQIDHVLDLVARQAHERVQLVLVAHGFEPAADLRARASDRGVSDLVVLTADRSQNLGTLMNRGVDAADGHFVAKMDDDNFYGRHYLGDLVRTFDWTGAAVAGKWAHYAYLQSAGATFLRFPAAEHRFTRLVQGGTLVMPRDVAVSVRFEDLPRRVDTTFLDKVAATGGTVYSADRYNFVSVRSTSTAGHTWKITDSELLALASGEPFFGEPWTHAEV
ncbi:glycosyl transferase family 2 [Luteimicrobium subarcticum]|uniref:Glycosyl transferase family 2 n=1 Tax=Luteimicrobium subarcticum TaxID=620910 RepID=A0A2M8WTH9_9MICO|nr:glycosyl transferase family 2 [Luteimicrobium subarcticum]